MTATGRKLFRRHSAPPGAAPGSFAARPAAPEPRVHVIAFDAGALEESDPADAAGAVAALSPGRVCWIDVQGLGEGALVAQLGERLGLHPLAVSDVVNLGQRPKVDEYDEALFFVLRMARLGADDELVREQVSLFLGDGFVLTFQETHGDCLDPLRERLRRGRTALRSAGAGYLACMVVDAIVDAYFPVLEHYGDQLERIEELVLEGRGREVLEELYGVRRDLLTFRRSTWPLRDALARLLHEEEDGRLDRNARLHLRDTVDHTLQVVDVTETYRELSASLLEVYLSTLGQRTNEVMRVLTVIATIFIPLTFVAGVYGMNFDRGVPGNMPELGWPYGYVLFWAICVGLAAALLVLFRRLGWLGGGASP